MKKMITVRNLSQLRCLKLEISAERAALERLRGCPYGGAARSLGVQNKNLADRTAQTACEVTYLEQLIAQNMKRCICELLRITEFINSIEDSELRIIFRERYVRCRTWTRIAFLLGGYDEQLPRRRHDRFLREFNAQKEKSAADRQEKKRDCTFCTSPQ
ncbi:MAG: hypothetical protein VB092_06695 [Oscillospiraceae bacterium]|nr:hypothetical protein [Oscillospiraceae bacterium]